MQRNFLILVLCIIVCLSCSKIDESAFEDIPTELEVTVLDDQSNPMPGAEVFLYRDRSSMDSHTGWSNRDTTDESGIITFTGLEAAQYFIYTHFEKGNSVYDNYKENFRVPVVLRESSLTKLEVETAVARPIDPDTVKIMGIHYPMDYEINKNEASCWLWSRIIKNDQLVVSTTDFHIYEYGEIQLWGEDYSQLLDPIYADMEDMYPFNIYGYKLLISDVLSLQNDYVLTLEHSNISNVVSNTISFDLDEIISDAINHQIPYPNRVRVGTTNTGYDELDFDLILEWK